MLTQRNLTGSRELHLPHAVQCVCTILTCSRGPVGGRDCLYGRPEAQSCAGDPCHNSVSSM
eukprot:scaffold28930_cov72-Phaeocystis_antarctica.AAC.1